QELSCSTWKDIKQETVRFSECEEELRTDAYETQKNDQQQAGSIGEETYKMELDTSGCESLGRKALLVVSEDHRVCFRNEDVRLDFMQGNLQTNPEDCEPGRGCVEEESAERSHLLQISDKLFSCLECGKNFKLKKYLQNHQKIHNEEKPYSCIECGRAFRQLINLKTHQRIHTGERPYSCGECGKAFNQLPALKTHQRIHSGEKPYHCPDCQKRFSSSSDLHKHQRLHTAQKPFPCSQCDKAFSHSSTLKAHQRIHTEETPLPSRSCGNSLSDSSECLVQHRQVHSLETNHPDDPSGPLSGQEIVLNPQTPKKWYECDECGKKVLSKRSLLQHQAIHTGEKPYCCDECGMRFALKTYFQYHQMVHSGERPYPCSLCEKTFRGIAHQRIHGIGKSYCCSKCGRTFKWKSSLSVHLKVHSAEVSEAAR
uniref:C2H2-type domain-containing protein n=1 Tax=Erpetoichthys calabaricus TaxID=27687 RepID=A0A8C4S9C2_ERPCA